MKKQPLPKLPMAAGDEWREHRRDFHLGDFVVSESTERTGELGATAFSSGFIRGVGYVGSTPMFRLEGPGGQERFLPVDDAILPVAGYCYRNSHGA